MHESVRWPIRLYVRELRSVLLLVVDGKWTHVYIRVDMLRILVVIRDELIVIWGVKYLTMGLLKGLEL